MISKENILKELPLRLREWFQSQRKWKTRTELARDLGINSRTFDDYFNGRNLPRGENLLKLVNVANLPILIEIQNLNSKNKQYSNTSPSLNKKEETPSSRDKGNPSLEKAHQVHLSLIKLNELLDFFKKATAEERTELKKTIPPQQIGYITSLLKALYNEDEFQQWIFFSEYKLK